MRQRILKNLFIVLGLSFVVIGVIGIFLPLLPTTPFLLLAALCFSKSSDRLHQWLLGHRILGPPIVDWNTHRVIGRRAKIFSITTILIGLWSVWIYFPTTSDYMWIGKITTMACMCSVMIFILCQKSSRL